MKIAVKTRESKRENDYDWNDYFPSNSDVITEATQFVRALEGSDVDRRFAAFVRSRTDAAPAVVVSVSTKRRDDVGGVDLGRPIRTMAFLRAGTTEESHLLAAFFAACLCESDANTLCNADSPLAKAVESLYKKKEPEEFIKFCQRLPELEKKGVALAQRWEIPRGNIDDRKKVTDALPSLIEGGTPFLLALTDRLPSDVLASLGSTFDDATVRIFSGAVKSSKRLPEPASQKHFRAAAFGGFVFLAILAAAIGSCSRGCGKGEGDGAGGERAGVGNCETNCPSRERGTVGSVQLITTNAPSQTQVETVTSTLPIRHDPDKLVSSVTTNVLSQETAGTNSLKTTSTRTENWKNKK